MTNFKAITQENFAGKNWRRYSDYHFAARRSWLPVVAAELAKLVPTLPLAFVPAGESWLLVALTALQPDDNWLVSPADGRWLGAYVPSSLRGYPFQYLQAADSDEMVLCFDQESGLLADSDQGEEFYAANGELAPSLAQVVEFLRQVEGNRRLTKQAVDALAAAELIQPWPLNLRSGEAEVPVSGLCRIDEKRMQQLSDESWLELRRAGALPVAYGQLLSMNQLAILAHAKKIRDQLQERAEAAAALPFAVSVEDDYLKFN